MSDTYYDHDGITIYHADNADMEWPAPVDVGLLLTDPPYGIAFAASGYWDNRTIQGDESVFDPQPLLRFDPLVLWGGRHYINQLPPGGGWIVWDKRDRTASTLPGSDAEMAWTTCESQVRIYRQVWMPHTIRGEPLLHPTQKPVGLMRWIVDKYTNRGDLVFDPYMGSGPVARACLDLGRRYVGIEIVEEYCQAAVDRLGQLALALDNV